MTLDPADDAMRELGDAEIEPPTAGFAQELELRLRAAHARAVAPDRSPAGGRRRLAAVAAVAVLAAGGAYVAAASQREAPTRLTSATDTSVVLPNGSIVNAHVGLDLPAGSVVITGPAGSAQVDGLRIPEDSQAVVVEGGAALVGAPPGTTRPPEVTAGSSTTRPPTTTTTVTATTRQAEPLRLVLEVERIDRRTAGLRWSAYDRRDFHTYSVVRTVEATAGGGVSSTVVFATADRRRLTYEDQLPAGTEQAAYRVLVRDADGRVIGATPVVRA